MNSLLIIVRMNIIGAFMNDLSQFSALKD
ncbi:uncharacterized protein METZ01_LOCUS71338 [marine metagenome]|uniref:Uncharacterized protein n=1 Tax=marine metagenome TaxID=408172 RepID=A0A381TRM8_9ZZZZ